MPASRSTLLLLATLLPCWSAAAAVDYTRQIEPLLQVQCVKCHGASTQKGNLRLDTAAAALKGGEHGPSIVPGKAEESVLIAAVEGRHGEVSKMPYKRPPLDTETVALLKRWIDEGAQAPAGEKPSDDRHWAYVPPQDTSSRLKTAQGKPATGAEVIDGFIRERLTKEGLKPAAESAPETLLRRLWLDVLGLPPTPAEVQAFLAEAKGGGAVKNEVWERWVNKALASPHYGERWGRWWLDQARYADSNGYSIDAPRTIWPYRDWVVNALNADLPFDQFSIEQLAGDLLPQATLQQKVATGFHRNTQVNGEGGIDPEQFRVESVVDRVGTTATVWLGLTVACAQCHDHKFDAISHKEYYQFYAFFNGTEQDGHGGTKTSTVTLPPVKDEGAIQQDITALRFELDRYFKDHPDAVNAAEAKLTAAQKAKLPKDTQKALAVPYPKRNVDQQRLVFAALVKDDKTFNKMNAQLKDREAGLSPKVTTLVMQELPQPRETRLFIKGDFTRPDAVVQRGTLAVLPPIENAANPSRLDLARWIVSPKNPLTARVIMNRVWQQYFGRGLVDTENDFGTMGSLPTHPELLDWLAVEFMRQKWSLKAMHKTLVMSATYRQSSSLTVAKAKSPAADPLLIDPRNYLLWRQTRLRLDAEIVRDVSLAASGLLSPKLGGPPVYPPIPEGVLSLGQVKRSWPQSKGEDRYRRGLYTFVFRATPPPSLSVFDAPEGFSSCTRRIRSNTPLQALTLLNDASFDEFAKGLGKRLLEGGQGAKSDAERIAHGFQLCTARQPAAEETQRLLQLLAEERRAGSTEPMAWQLVARVLLNLDETVTRE